METEPNSHAFTIYGTRGLHRIDSNLMASRDSDDQTSDDTLIRKAQRGDQSAFAELLVRYDRTISETIQKIIRRRCQDHEDVAQDARLRVFSGLPKYEIREHVPFAAWVRRVAVRATLNHIKNCWKWTWVEMTPAVEPLSYPETLVLQDQIQKCIDRLPKADRELFLRRFCNHQEDALIAQETSLSVTNVRVRLHRIKLRLAECLGTPSSKD